MHGEDRFPSALLHCVASRSCTLRARVVPLETARAIELP
jgi:hypothetical protein